MRSMLPLRGSPPTARLRSASAKWNRWRRPEAVDHRPDPARLQALYSPPASCSLALRTLLRRRAADLPRLAADRNAESVRHLPSASSWSVVAPVTALNLPLPGGQGGYTGYL